MYKQRFVFKRWEISACHCVCEPNTLGVTEGSVIAANRTGCALGHPELVRGHEKVSTGGQLRSPLVATKSPHWWPGEVPALH
jgi:hypothetical protein